MNRDKTMACISAVHERQPDLTKVARCSPQTRDFGRVSARAHCKSNLMLGGLLPSHSPAEHLQVSQVRAGREGRRRNLVKAGEHERHIWLQFALGG